MIRRSHIDMERIKEIRSGEHFGYKDVVSHSLPISEHPEDGAIFNREVEEGLYKDIVILNEDDDQVIYKKI